MWLHIVIFVILFLLAAGSRLGWLHVEQIGTQKGRKLFLAVALTGNIMGLAMTCTKGGGEIYQDGYELKKEENSYEEKFMVSMEGEETGSIYVQIPEKEMEEEDSQQQEVLTEEGKLEKKASGFYCEIQQPEVRSRLLLPAVQLEWQKSGMENSLR